MPKRTYIRGLLDELEKAELEAEEAFDAREEAHLLWNVATIKYAAVRDATTEALSGDNPYAPGSRNWPRTRRGRGRFRFVRMNPGDAALTALREVDEPLTLQEVHTRLRKGGLSFSVRGVNAALLQKAGIERLKPAGGEEEEARYRAIEEDD